MPQLSPDCTSVIMHSFCAYATSRLFKFSGGSAELIMPSVSDFCSSSNPVQLLGTRWSSPVQLLARIVPLEESLSTCLVDKMLRVCGETYSSISTHCPLDHSLTALRIVERAWIPDVSAMIPKTEAELLLFRPQNWVWRVFPMPNC